VSIRIGEVTLQLELIGEEKRYPAEELRAVFSAIRCVAESSTGTRGGGYTAR